uniref:Uncharacterized protein n=1 Tax=Timema tahoe TaxID=61484 RepID=A0A7R9P1U0_9NEOP|nr:unnamed protein product [Timema tahoe]
MNMIQKPSLETRAGSACCGLVVASTSKSTDGLQSLIKEQLEQQPDSDEEEVLHVMAPETSQEMNKEASVLGVVKKD